jgi:hypothetical protein
MALHHDVQAPGPGGDIFAKANGFSSYGLSIATAVDGYTAMGLTTREVDTAALGMTHAEALAFPGAPTFDGTHPKLIGEIFWRAASGQMIILNLDNVAHTADISKLVSSGTCRQIYGEAGSYVDGNAVPGGFEGYDDASLAPANLTLATGTLAPASLSLPAFSITRIVANLKLPFPPRPAAGQ